MKAIEFRDRLDKAIRELGDIDIFCIPFVNSPEIRPAEPVKALWHWPADAERPERLEVG